YDFVAWEYRSGTSGDHVTYRVPISCFGVRPRLALMNRWLEEINAVLESGEQVDRANWHRLGRDILNPLLKEFVESGQMTYRGLHAETLTVPIKLKDDLSTFYRLLPIAPYIKDDPLQPHISYFNSWMPKMQKMSEKKL